MNEQTDELGQHRVAVFFFLLWTLVSFSSENGGDVGWTEWSKVLFFLPLISSSSSTLHRC